MVTSYEQGFAWKKAEIGPRAHQAARGARREDAHLDRQAGGHGLAREAR